MYLAAFSRLVSFPVILSRRPLRPPLRQASRNAANPAPGSLIKSPTPSAIPMKGCVTACAPMPPAVS